MDFRLTPEQETFRAEVRAWLSGNLPPDWSSRVVVTEVPRAELYDFGRHWQRKLHEAGLLGLTWPKEYGGGGPPDGGAPPPRGTDRAPGAPRLNIVGLGICGSDDHPVRHPRPEERHLQKILTGEELWCQLYSRAQGGLRPGLVPDPRRAGRRPYVVKGQKVWTAGLRSPTR